MFLSFHSYGEVIIFPWGYTGEPCSDYVELLEGGTAMAKVCTFQVQLLEATTRYVSLLEDNTIPSTSVLSIFIFIIEACTIEPTLTYTLYRN